MRQPDRIALRTNDVTQEDDRRQDSGDVLSLGAIENIEPVILCEADIPEVQMEMDDDDAAESSTFMSAPPTSTRRGHTSFSEARSQRALSSPRKGGGMAAGGAPPPPRFPALSISISEDDAKVTEKVVTNVVFSCLGSIDRYSLAMVQWEG